LCLRLHPKLIEGWPGEEDARKALLAQVREGGESSDADAVRGALVEYADRAKSSSAPPPWPEQVTAKLRCLNKRHWRLLPYPCGSEGDQAPPVGFVFQSRRRLGLCKALCDEEDAGEDELSGTVRVPLADHTRNVAEAATAVAEQLLPPDWVDVFAAAAEGHDLGKADPRFQALLLGGDALAARFLPTVLAKGDPATSRAEFLRQYRRSGLPDGFRHELLSVQLAEAMGRLPEDSLRRDLVLHLIASHHGRCRPFAPVVTEDDPPGVWLASPSADLGYHWAAAERRAWTPPHQLDSGIADRFWRLVRHFGWWGLAYLEALFRLADWQASGDEQSDDVAHRASDHILEAVS
jgi:CRISPR-associated endonuclease/helicase Cas3